MSLLWVGLRVELGAGFASAAGLDAVRLCELWLRVSLVGGLRGEEVVGCCRGAVVLANLGLGCPGASICSFLPIVLLLLFAHLLLPLRCCL